MKLKTCEYCGTEYNSELPTCPLCGKTGAGARAEAPQEQRKKRGGARVAPKKSAGKRQAKPADPDKIPRWMWALICVILGLAVIIGAVYFVYIMGFFGKSTTTQQQTQQTQQTDDTQQQDAQKDEQEEEQTSTSGVPCTALTLSQTDATLDEQGGHIFLTAVARPADCTDEITFQSSDESVVTINENGMITAVAPGEAEIIVTCGSITERCAIHCDFEVAEPDEPDTPDETQEPDTPDETQEPDTPDVSSQDGSDASLSSTDFTLFTPGEQTTLTVRNAPAGATITYVSSNAAVVTVTNTGLVTAVGSGTATITVTVNSTKLTCIARCNLGDSAETGDTGSGSTSTSTNYTISHTDVTLFRLGESFQITLSDASGSAPSSVSWSTSNGGVASVDSGGTVTATGSGTATITATVGGKSYSCIVRCGF